VADRVVVLTNGRVTASGSAAELAGSDLLRHGYMAA
jgi:ABC-type branched-subunit amino acid transport system ATPase component